MSNCAVVTPETVEQAKEEIAKPRVGGIGIDFTGLKLDTAKLNELREEFLKPGSFQWKLGVPDTEPLPLTVDYSELEKRAAEGYKSDFMLTDFKYKPDFKTGKFVADFKLSRRNTPDLQEDLYRMNVFGARTGRFSCSKPNVEQVESPTGRTDVQPPETQYIRFSNGSVIKANPLRAGEKLRGERASVLLVWDDNTDPVRSIESKFLNTPPDTVYSWEPDGRLKAHTAFEPRWRLAESMNDALAVDVRKRGPKGAHADPKGSEQHVPFGSANDMSIRSDYLRAYLHGENLAKAIEATRRALERVEFDAIAFRGMSGALVAPAVAAVMGKELIMVRKKDGGDRNTHSSRTTEGPKYSRKYVIIDDFISSGETVNVMVKQIRDELNPEHKCVGIVEYWYLPKLNHREWRMENGDLVPCYGVPVDTVSGKPIELGR